MFHFKNVTTESELFSSSLRSPSPVYLSCQSELKFAYWPHLAFYRAPDMTWTKRNWNCRHDIAITCARNTHSWPQNTNSWPRSRYNVRTKYKLIILISFLDSWVSKSSAPSLETAIAYVMSLRWLSYLILFWSISCYLAFRQCLSLIISFESSIMCFRLSAEGIQRLYEPQHLMMPLNAAVQLQ